MPAVLLLAVLTHAAPHASIDLKADLGFGGWIVPGVWTPLRVEVFTRQAIDGELVVTTSGASGRESRWRHPIQLSPGTRQRVDLDVLIGDPRQPVRLAVEQRGARLILTRIVTPPLRVSEGIVIGLTEDAAGLEIVSSLPRGLRPAYLRETQLPRRWQNYEGVALVVIRDLIDSRLRPEQREALIQWVAQGGRVLVTGGNSSALRVGWLREILPAIPGVMRSFSLPIVSGTGLPVSVTHLTPRPTADVMKEGDTAVSAWWHYGRGIATIWAFDPFLPDARAWPTRRRLWSSVLQMQPTPAASSADVGRVLPSSQSLPGRVQFGLVLLLVLYVLAVRYTQRRWVPRAGLIGLGAVSAIFGSLMYVFALNARSSAVAASQITVIEAFTGLGSAGATTYVSIANPYGSPYRLRAPEDATIRALDGIAVTYSRRSGDVSAAGPARGQLFESLQIVPQTVTVQMVERGSGAELSVQTDPAIRISSPVVFLRGRVHRLPDFTGSLSFGLEPTRWEGVNGPSSQVREELRARIRSALFVRLRELEPLRERPWLIGWVSDPRARVALSEEQAGSALQLLVAEVTTGR